MHIATTGKAVVIIFDNRNFGSLQATGIVLGVQIAIKIATVQIAETLYLFHQLYVDPQQLHDFQANGIANIDAISADLNKQIAGRGGCNAVFALHIRKRRQFNGDGAGIKFTPVITAHGNNP